MFAPFTGPRGGGSTGWDAGALNNFGGADLHGHIGIKINTRVKGAQNQATGGTHDPHSGE
jgi:hypothetical protein